MLTVNWSGTVPFDSGFAARLFAPQLAAWFMGGCVAFVCPLPVVCLILLGGV